MSPLYGFISGLDIPSVTICAVAPDESPVIAFIVELETKVPETLFNLILLLFRKSITTPLAVLFAKESP